MKTTTLALVISIFGVVGAFAAEPSPAPSAATAPAAAAAPAADPEVFLFSYFRGGSQDGLHLATSPDGYHWELLNDDRSFLRPEVGGRLMRDPSLWRGPDGTFHLVWTTAWNGTTIGYASTKDFRTWSEQKAIPVMAAFPDTRNCWAPEVRYDKDKGEYLVYWSSVVGGDNYQRTYATTTKDFETFAPAKVFFDPGWSQIDASILEDGGKFLLFYKRGGQGTRIAEGTSLQGPYADMGVQFAYPNADQWEGAWPVKLGEDYLAYTDHYRNAARMGLWRSRDLKEWENVTAQTTGLRDIRHGSVVRVPASFVNSLKAALAAAPAPAAVPSAPAAPPAPPVVAPPAGGVPAAPAASSAANSEQKETYVLVHGAWGGGWDWKTVDDLLTAAGHKVYRTTLTGQGEKVHLATPDVDLNTHITDIENVIVWERLQNVVLVGHSYGGMVITGVADRVPERIKRLVYLDAFLPENGESLTSANRGSAPPAAPAAPAATDAPPASAGAEGTAAPPRGNRRGGRGINFNIVDGFAVLPGANFNRPPPRDVPQPAKTLSQPVELKNEDKTKSLPVTYILFTPAGRGMEQAQFYRFYQRARDKGYTVLTLESDHNAQRSHPRELALMLQQPPPAATAPAPAATP